VVRDFLTEQTANRPAQPCVGEAAACGASCCRQPIGLDGRFYALLKARPGNYCAPALTSAYGRAGFFDHLVGGLNLLGARGCQLNHRLAPLAISLSGWFSLISRR
jgi:hypothetical protein